MRYEMALVFESRMAMSVQAVAFFTVALTAPPTATLFLMPPATVFAIAAIGITAIVLLVSDAIGRLGAAPLVVRVGPSGYPDPASARIVAAPGTGVRTLLDGTVTTPSLRLGACSRYRDAPIHKGSL